MKRILLGVACFLLLGISWIVAVTAKSSAQKQLDLLEQAAPYMEDGAYVVAVPYLEEAAAYEDAHTLEAETVLKEAYLHLLDTKGYRRKYVDLLTKEMEREDAAPEVFREAAEYYQGLAKMPEMLSALRGGIEKTGDAGLLEMYEDLRYAYDMDYSAYEDVTEICNGAIQVMREGQWGLAYSDGTLMIPCMYDKISTYSDGTAVVLKDGQVYTIDSDNNRTALYHGAATDIGNLSGGRIGLKTAEGWVLANGSTLNTAAMAVEEIGMYTNDCLAAKSGGKWGLLAANGREWNTEPTYSEIIRDELGRCSAQGALFIREGDTVRLLVGEETVGSYEDARPFADGWAAVKKNGKWGFIDTAGTVQIDYQFDDALSFGQHLAAVQMGEYWGYVSRYGEMVIAPQFLNAKSFSDGRAPVQTEKGWQFITLLEYDE